MQEGLSEVERVLDFLARNPALDANGDTDPGAGMVRHPPTLHIQHGGVFPQVRTWRRLFESTFAMCLSAITCFCTHLQRYSRFS